MKATATTDQMDVQEATLYALKKHMHNTRQQVCMITGLSNDEINQYTFDNAFEWLEDIGCDAYGLDHLPKTAEFWGFWKKNWHLTDCEFLKHYNQWQYSNTQEWYKRFHSYAGPMKDSTVIHAGYHQMVKEISKSRFSK